MCLNSPAMLPLPLPDKREPNESVSHSPFSVSLQLSCKYWFDPGRKETEEEMKLKIFWRKFEEFFD